MKPAAVILDADQLEQIRAALEAATDQAALTGADDVAAATAEALDVLDDAERYVRKLSAMAYEPRGAVTLH